MSTFEILRTKVSLQDGGDQIDKPLLAGESSTSVTVGRVTTSETAVSYSPIQGRTNEDDEDQENAVAFKKDASAFGQQPEELDNVEHASRTPWNMFWTNPAGLTLIINNWVYGWIGFLLLSEMPAYLQDVLGFSLQMSGLLCIFPYVAMS